MPLYEFKCTECGTVFEELCSSSRTTAAVACVACKSRKVKKLFSSFSPAASPLPHFECNNPAACPSARACGGSCGMAR